MPETTPRDGQHQLLTATVDGRQISVGRGTTVLVAAKQLGIRIPTLCNDARLEPFGGCRMCIVEIEGARAPVVSCATLVTDGMVVRTDTDEIRRLRKTVIELLLSDHPNECMTCDATGACDLQDLAYEYDARWDRFAVPAAERGADAAQDRAPEWLPPLGDRHVDDDNKFIAREYSKCILCGRCVRICDEVEQVCVYDFMNRSYATRVDTPYSKSLTDTPCELCGQCVSTCPTGALLGRQSLGKGRSWQVEATQTVCTYCGTGCVLELLHKDGAIVGARGVPDKGPNWGNLCIKGRFGWQFINSPDRLTAPLVRRSVADATGLAALDVAKTRGAVEREAASAAKDNGGRSEAGAEGTPGTGDATQRERYRGANDALDDFVPVSWDDAIGLVAGRLARIKHDHGPDAIAGLTSARCPNEENYAFQKFIRGVIGTNNIDNCARL